MSKYETLKGYDDKEFRRITGVKRATFSKMVAILEVAYISKHMRRSRQAKLCTDDMLLATLEYLREYRTFAHIAASYGIHESNMYRTIRWVEDTLITLISQNFFCVCHLFHKFHIGHFIYFL